MGLLAAALRADAEAWSAYDDRWYTSDICGLADSGIVLGAESILRCGTVLAAVRFLADAWAMCPPQTFRRTPRGREEAPEHYSQTVLRDPNAWQTGYRWRHVNMTWLATWGNAYNEIVAGSGAFVDELRPIHPSRIRVKSGRQRPDGTLLYDYSPPSGTTETWGQERLLHFRGISTDGMSGEPMYQLIRNAVGIAMAAEKHLEAFLRKGSRLAGLLIPTSPLDLEQRTELKNTVNRDLGGVRNTGSFGVMPFGVDIKPIASNNRESQLFELTDRQVGEILRFLGVPGVVVGYGEKTATYASAKEFFESGGIKHCILPWVTNLEQEEQKALMLRGDPHYIKHNLDVLMRANTKDRYQAIFQAVGGPWQSVNEARELEDFNRSGDPQHDKILTPVNMTTDPGAGEPGPPPPAAPLRRREPPPPDDDADRLLPAPARTLVAAHADDNPAVAIETRAEQFVYDAAMRVIGRERAVLKGRNGYGKALLFARDPAGWQAWVRDYYRDHAAFVAATLHVSPDIARAYCERQAATLIAEGAAVAETWEETVAPQLAALALEN